jgi:hypothetical protein
MVRRTNFFGESILMKKVERMGVYLLTSTMTNRDNPIDRGRRI